MTGKSILQYILIGLIFVCAASALQAQTTAFTYQGKLTDSGTPQAVYQMEFRLFGSASGADQIGATVTNPGVAVNQGVFSVLLDFGAPAFSGADRYLQISVRRSAGESFTILNPRQQLTSSPYSIRTLSAAQADISLDANKLGGISANQYVTTSSVGNSFIRNSTAQQTGANFNIDGSGLFGGSVGIGINPFSGVKLDVNGDMLVRTSGSGGNIQLGTPNTETGMSIAGASQRADVRFDGATLKMIVGPAGAPPLATSGIVVNTAGNVGIGTVTPRAKLDISGNAVQDRDRGGIIKAAVYVAGNGTLVRCYNGVTGVSGGNCGFSVTRAGAGLYQVNFAFQVSDRFISATTSSNALSGNINTSAQVGFDVRNPNTFVTVRTFAAGDVQLLNDSDFFITVY